MQASIGIEEGIGFHYPGKNMSNSFHDFRQGNLSIDLFLGGVRGAVFFHEFTQI